MRGREFWDSNFEKRYLKRRSKWKKLPLKVSTKIRDWDYGCEFICFNVNERFNGEGSQQVLSSREKVFMSHLWHVSMKVVDYRDNMHGKRNLNLNLQYIATLMRKEGGGVRVVLETGDREQRLPNNCFRSEYRICLLLMSDWSAA